MQTSNVNIPKNTINNHVDNYKLISMNFSHNMRGDINIKMLVITLVCYGAIFN